MQKHYTKNILDIKIDFGLTRNAFLQKVADAVDNDIRNYVCTVNPEYIVQAQTDTEFKELLNSAYINTPDGSGVLMAEKYDQFIKSKKVKNPLAKLAVGLGIGVWSGLGKYDLGPKLSGSDLIYDICSLAEKNNYTVMFVGGWQRYKNGKRMPNSGKLAERVAQAMQNKFPNLKVVFASSEVLRDPEHDEETIKEIHLSMERHKVKKIDIVFAAFNAKHTELWLHRNMEKIPASFGIGVGGTFEFVLGLLERASKNMSKHNIEWLKRLTQEPWRVKRVLNAFPIFPWKVFIQSLK